MARWLSGTTCADGVLDLAEDSLRLLDPGAGRGADVHAELPGVHGGEEVLAEAGKEGSRAQREAEQNGQRAQAVVQRPVEETAVGLAETLEATIEGLVEG